MKSSLIVLAASFSFAFAQNSFCPGNAITVTITPTVTKTCGGTIYTTTTLKATTVTVPPSEASHSIVTVASTLYLTPSPVAELPSSSILEAASSASPLISYKASSAGTPTTLSFVYASTAAAGLAGKKEAAHTSVSKLASSSIKASTSVKASSSKVSSAAAAATPSSSSDNALGGSNSGQATYYGDGSISGGMCSFTTYTLPSGIFGTALSDSNWDTAANCGACVSVTGPSGNSVRAMIVDQCPGCGLNHLDLFPDAFSALADPSKGVIDVSWNVVPCDITSPITLHNKDGVSAYWFSMQVVNANVPVKSLEVSTDNSVTWQATERQDYNFFQQASGFGTTTVDVRVTSTTGEKIIVKGVNIASGASTEASSNFSS